MKIKAKDVEIKRQTIISDGLPRTNYYNVYSTLYFSLMPIVLFLFNRGSFLLFFYYEKNLENQFFPFFFSFSLIIPIIFSLTAPT